MLPTTYVILYDPSRNPNIGYLVKHTGRTLEWVLKENVDAVFAQQRCAQIMNASFKILPPPDVAKYLVNSTEAF